MLLIAEVDCHDVDHVMFEVVKLYLVGLLSVAWLCSRKFGKIIL